MLGFQTVLVSLEEILRERFSELGLFTTVLFSVFAMASRLSGSGVLEVTFLN